MKKHQIFGLVFIALIAFYGITAVFADNTTTDQTSADGMHYQHGSMDGSQNQIHMQLRDGSGAGGMYQHNNGIYNNGTCNQ